MTAGRLAVTILKLAFFGGVALVAFWIVLFVFVGQPWTHRYSGDGTFSDYGFNPDGGRYWLKLGRFDLTSSAGQRRTFAVGKLPQGMVLGLVFTVVDAEEERRVEALRFKVRAYGADGRSCVDYEGTMAPPVSAMTEMGVDGIGSPGEGQNEHRVVLGASCSGWSLFGLGARPMTVELTQLAPIERPLRTNSVLVQLSDY
jgi:hypothetical protein